MLRSQLKMKKKRWYDDDADWVPQKGRQFVMKKTTQKNTEEPATMKPKATIQREDFQNPPTDKEGLERAYAQGDTYIWGDTLYIAGSHTARDWFDDVTKVPFWGDLRGAERYQAAEKALKAHKNIRRVIGHSLGGSVALELQKNYKGLASRTYGAPVWDPLGQDYMKYGKVERYNNLFDPVSMFDKSVNSSFKWDLWTSPSLFHAYDNIAKNFTAEKPAPPPNFSFDEPDDKNMIAMTE